MKKYVADELQKEKNVATGLEKQLKSTQSEEKQMSKELKALTGRLDQDKSNEQKLQ